MANRKMTQLKTKLVQLLPTRSLNKVGSLGIAVALLLSSSNLYALGLGSLEIESNLDQPLRGTIQLRVSPGDDLETLSAVIASREDFESLGIDYPSYLENFSILLDPFGEQRVLRVTSNDVIIKEPFIHFLVRVEWSGGSFLREYTALIDPPVYAAEAPASISEPREVGTDQTFRPSQSTPAPVQQAPAAPQTAATPAPQSQASPEPAPIEDDNFYNDGAETASQSTVEYSAASLPLDATYGPVESGESLSVIAQDLQRQFPDLSIYQIMKVLFEENVDSFIGANINGLIQGSILRIGDLNAIRSVDIAESKAFYSQQINEWDPQLLFPSGSDSINVGQDNYNFQDDDSFGSELTDSSGFDTEDSFQVGASTESDDFVSSDQGSNRDGEVLALRQQITSLQTSLTSSELENIELSERISLLEGQLADMNRLAELSVESADLANIESTLAEQNDDFDNGESAIDDFLDETEDANTVDEFLTSEIDSAETLAEQADQAIDELVAGEDSNSDLIDSEVDSAEEFDSVVAETVSDPEAINENAQDIIQEESFLDSILTLLFDGGLWKILAGLGAILVAGAGLLFLRRRRADEEFEISMLSIESNSHSVGHSESTADASSMSASHTASMASEAVNADKETSFLTVYSDSDAVVQADEVDPVAEADVYIAYGRDEQAEEVLLDGIVSNPDRIDIKRKLLNLYHKRQNEEGFERIAEELYSQRAALTGDMWQQVCEMGKEILPDNPLFELSGDDLNTAVEVEEVNSELLLEGDSVSEVPIEADVSDDDSMAFESPSLEAVDHLDNASSGLEGSMEIEDESEIVVGSLSEDESIQLINFDDGRSEISELDEVEIDALEFGDDSDDALDLSDFNSDELAAAGPADRESKEDVASSDTATDTTLNEDDEFLDFNIEESVDADLEQSENSESTISEVHEVSDLEIDPDYDESRTQYELAKVFVDLGDEDGARKILVELVDSNDISADVLHDTKELLDSIS